MALYRALAAAGNGVSVRPVVGVTGPAERFPQAWWMTRLAIHLCGGHAVYLTPASDNYQQLLNAVIIGGGAVAGEAHRELDGHESFGISIKGYFADADASRRRAHARAKSRADAMRRARRRMVG